MITAKIGIIFNTHKKKEFWPRRGIFTLINLDLEVRERHGLAHELHPEDSIVYHRSLLNRGII